MFTRTFLLPALERALKSAAQALIGLLLGDFTFNIWQVDPAKALGVAVGAAVLSLLTSVVSYKAGPTGSPSLVADPLAAAAADPIEALADHDRRVQRADLAAGLEAQQRENLDRLRPEFGPQDERLHGRQPDPPDYPDPSVTGRHQPGEHRRDPDLPPR